MSQRTRQALLDRLADGRAQTLYDLMVTFPWWRQPWVRGALESLVDEGQVTRRRLDGLWRYWRPDA